MISHEDRRGILGPFPDARVSTAANTGREGRRRVLIWSALAGATTVVLAGVLSVALIIVPFASSVRSVAQDAQVVETAARAADLQGTASGMRRLADSSQELTERSGSLPWSALANVPVVGPNLEALHRTASAMAYVSEAAAPLLERVTAASSSAERIRAVVSSSDDLASLASVLQASAQDLKGIDPGSLNFGLGETVSSLQERLPSLADQARAAAEATRHLSGMVGVGSKRTWLVMLQNPAEARGTGGLFSAFARVQVEDGSWSILEASSRKDALDEIDIPYQKVLQQRPSTLWGDNLQHWASFNLSVDFPLNAQLAAAGMAARGTPVDGVIAIDPAVLAALLAGTGPVEHQGVTINAATAEQFFLKDIYAQFSDFPDVPAKDRLTMGLLFATVSAVQDRPLDLASMAAALAPVIESGHVKVWSANPAEEQWLTTTSVGGEVPGGPGPIVAVSLNNAAGGKIDAYLKTTIDYAIDSCRPASSGYQNASVTITLTNEAPDGLPDYVDFRLDDPSGPAGSTSMIVTVLGPVGSSGITVDLDGAPTPFAIRTERGKPAWSAYLAIGQGDSPVMTFRFRQPTTSDHEPELITQSMANAPAVRAHAECVTPKQW